MEVESDDEEDERGAREDGRAAQLDQDTQLQDMDEVRQPGWSSRWDEKGFAKLALRRMFT